MSASSTRDPVEVLAAEGLKSPDELRRMAAGMAAAPEPVDGTARLRLVDETAAPERDAALRQLIAEYRLDGDSIADSERSGERLAALRAELAARGLDAFLVPMADEYQNEFVPQRALRIAWLSGFTGSAGLIIVLAETAAIFVDGRYTLQVRDQVDTALFETRHVTEEPPGAWIEANLGSDGKLGFDPWHFTKGGADRMRAAAEAAGGSLVAVADNPLDAVWTDQPAPPLAPVVPHDMAFAGEASAEKRGRIARTLSEAGLDGAVVTAPDSIAWLLNIRGADVPRTPLPLSYLTLDAEGRADLFVDERKLSPGLEAHLGNAVAVRPAEDFAPGLDALAGRKLRVDPASAASWVFERLAAAGAEVVEGKDPCQLPKAIKNAVELDGTRAAHARDGIAMARFLAWLEAETPGGEVDELSALDRLAAFRREGEHFRDLSFDTISGAGANGAVVHYRASAETNRRLEAGSLYLVDSGAQYLDGTTDITRTVAIGTPTAEMCDRFTRVLQGHIRLAAAIFPKGTTGSQLDTLARAPIWRAGLDFDHGTGHGVGSYLGVHEGPQGISKMQREVALEPGMVISNEPGYYKTGAYGIRIENLVAVTPAEIAGGEREMLAFETLTLAPIDRRLIAVELLAGEERAWLDAYHARVRETVGPTLDPETRAWLEAATRPL